MSKGKRQQQGQVDLWRMRSSVEFPESRPADMLTCTNCGLLFDRRVTAFRRDGGAPVLVSAMDRCPICDCPRDSI